MRTISCDSKNKCDREAVTAITKCINSLLQRKDIVTLGIPGGRSVSGIFEGLKQAAISWGRVHIFMVDERMVPLNHKDSNFRQAQKLFLQHLIDTGILPEENVHPFNLEKGIEGYKKELAKFGGKYDVLLFSSGEDGHIGAIFPDHHSVKDKNDSFLTMEDSPKPPSSRMTISASLVKKAEVGLVLFYGEGKKEAYDKFLDEDLLIKKCPAKLVLETGESIVVTDLE